MKIREAMTQDVYPTSPDQTLRDAAKLMAKIDAGVPPVEEDDRLVGVIADRDKRLVGIVSFADLARHHDATMEEKALRELSEPGGAHSQTTH